MICMQDQVGLVHCFPVMSNKKGGPLRCKRIAVKDVIAGKLLAHHFVKDPGCKMRDIGISRSSVS